jgi:hypothetical protein
MTNDSLQLRQKGMPAAPGAGLEISGSRKEDLEKARALETAQYAKTLDQLETVERARRERILDEMARRGLQNSDACLQALLEARVDTLSQAVRRRLTIRRDLLRLYPELGSPKELDRLMERIHGEVSALWEESQKSGLLVVPEVFAELRKKGQEGIDLLRQEGLASRPKVASVSPAPPKLPISTVPARISPGAANPAPKPKVVLASTATPPADASPELTKACAVVEQLTQELEGRNAKLAASLLKLAHAIRDSRGAGSDRASYMDQLQFLGEQALRPAVLRRRGVVQGLLIALQNEVESDAAVALLRWEAGALLAAHFGVRWAPPGKPGKP